jgi:hypothetical protein
MEKAIRKTQYALNDLDRPNQTLGDFEGVTQSGAQLSWGNSLIFKVMCLQGNTVEG